MRKISFIALALLFALALATTGRVQDKKVTQLTEDTAPTSDDYTMTINDPAGTPANRRVTLANFIKGLSAFTGDAGAGGAKGLVPAPASGDAAALKFLKADGTWAVPAGTGMSNPMTTAGDLIYGGSGGTPTRLAAGTNGHVLTLASGVPTWAAAAGGGSYAGVTTGGTGSLDFAQGTKTANEPFIDGTVTWNNSGVTFEGIRLNAADNASGANSTLLKLMRSDGNVFQVFKNGNVSADVSGATLTLAQNGFLKWSSEIRLTPGGSGSSLKVQDSGGGAGTIAFASRSLSLSAGTTDNPDFGNGAYFYRLTPNAAGSTLTGGRDIPGSVDGEKHAIYNVGSAGLILANNNTGSSAGRRWITNTGMNLYLAPNEHAPYLYDATSNNHRIGKFETSDTAAITTQFDKTNTTLADVTLDRTINVSAGRTYKFEIDLPVSADATGGSKFAIGGTATATSIYYQVSLLDNSSGAHTITSRQTALAGSAGQAGTTAGHCRIVGVIKVNAAGTLTLQFAQNAASGTSSLLVGGTFTITLVS